MIIKTLKTFIILFVASMLFVINTLEAEKIKIVVLAPLTGPIAEYGLANTNGILLAIKHAPKDFAQIEFIFEDTVYDPKTSLALYRKYRADRDVKLIYSWGSNPSQSITPIADRECFPLFIVDLSISAYQASKKAGENSCVLNFVNSQFDITKPLAEYLAKNNFKNVGIIKTENAYLNGMLAGLKHNKRKDIQIETIANVGIEEVDFKTIISKLKNSQFDSLGVFLFPGQISSFYRQMRDLNYIVPSFGTDTFESREEIVKSGALMQGAVYAHLDVSDKFRIEYTSEYGNDSQITTAGASYDFANLVAKLFTLKSKLKQETNQNIVNAFKTIPDQLGVLGKFYFEESLSEGARFKFPVYLKKIKGDSYEVIF